MQAPCYLKKINGLAGVRADFVERIPGIVVDTDREATLARLQPEHEARVKALGFEWAELQRAEQVHGAEIAMVERESPVRIWPGVDGLLTADPGVLLGIYVADCGAVYLSDQKQGVLGLLHSGKKGTEGNITGKAIAMMQNHYGSRPEDIEVALAPCIRPPHYEVNFASQIRKQVLDAGVPEHRFTDSGLCTGSDLEHYYSYRIERGCTGRMLALLGRVDVSFASSEGRAKNEKPYAQ
ncbi:laccase domain-containing protein [Verrucomicrobiaceae bacterium N1E253]|uniref:Laccase domain-containing protein n=2 Tax=Oceaniferula marina TaxID=2748318 RepID=A0A851GMT8_9BACT|nr:laccase domain-containing protein [Oceaniferula marina]